jgi:hypothetical protein
MVMKWVLPLLIAALTTACTQPGASPLSPVEQPSVGQAPVEPPLAEPPTAPVVPTTGPTLEREDAGYRVRIPGGSMGASYWINAGALLTTWSPAGDMEPHVFLLDADGGRLTEVMVGDSGRVVVSPNGKQALLLNPRQAVLVDTAVGNSRVVHRFEQGETELDAVWLTPDRFLVRMGGGSRSRYGWGKLVLGDAAGLERTLSEAGRVVAVFADGAVLVHETWVDGPLMLYTPPYDQPPVQVSEGGNWAYTHKVSGDGQSVAWLDMAPPPGDWSERIPSGCCGEPGATSRGVAIYDRQTNRVVRYVLDNARPGLYWQQENSGLLVAVREREFAIGLYRMGVDGRLTRLAGHGYTGPLRPVAEGPDGELYYTVMGREGQNWTELIRLDPGGGSRLLHEGIPGDWEVDALGRLVRWTNEQTTVTDLATGRTYTAPLRGWPSPANRWVVSNGLSDPPGALRVLPLTPVQP